MQNLPSSITQNPSETWETETELVIRTSYGLTDFWIIIPTDTQAGHKDPLTSWEPESDFFANITNEELRSRLKLLVEQEARKFAGGIKPNIPTL